MSQKASVDKNLCIACGSCISTCPACFTWGDDGKAQYAENTSGGSCNLAEIVGNCPVMAITVEEV